MNNDRLAAIVRARDCLAISRFAHVPHEKTVTKAITMSAGAVTQADLENLLVDLRHMAASAGFDWDKAVMGSRETWATEARDRFGAPPMPRL